MTPEERADLIKYRMEKAAHTLRQAEALGAMTEWDGAANRTYYAMFYAAVAMLAKQDVSARTHSGVLALVDRELVRLGLLPRQEAAHLREAFRLRQRADYAETDPIDAERGQELIEAAQSFLKQAERMLNDTGDPRP